MKKSSVGENAKRVMAKAMLDEVLQMIESKGKNTLRPDELIEYLQKFAAEPPTDKLEQIRSDLTAAQDLLDTLAAHKDGCVGMAANMIGVNKRIIVFDNDGTYMLMFNPVIVRRDGLYEAEEGCLSLTGLQRTKRWQSIKVQWQNEKFQTRLKTFTGWTAQIIQHEIDHCDGILI